MSYRLLKRLLGETNFEIKCLALFGFGLTLLAAGTFALYWLQTSELVDKQNRMTARLLVAPIILEKHWKWAEAQPEFEKIIERLAGELQPEDLRDYRWELFKPDPATSQSPDRPSDDEGYEALEKLRQGKDEVVNILPDLGEGEYHYYGAVKASKSCLNCHWHKKTVTASEELIDVKEGDLIGVVKITLPLNRAQAALHKANAFVITAEFVKIVLAILAIYLIMRYVITKPVLHLKKVSDAIAHGNLEMRADIRTGDEFEELSHAFNRMLRHLFTLQEELRDVNEDLDGKVDELARVNLQLYEMNKLKDEFLATMSHELRTPLNSILGFSDVLKDAENLTEKQDRYVANIQIAGRNLMALINDVLDLAKIESGKMELHVVEFSISDLVERQVGTTMPLAEQKNIELTWAAGPDLPVLVQDAGKLQQVLNNLLSNAIKFTPEGGRVRVSAGCLDDSTLELTVEDTGVGIPLEDQETIFEKFRQGANIPGQRDAITRQYEGTGLGLSIVKELTKLLGGEVLLDSEFGKGSTFTVHVPLCLADPSHSQRPDESRVQETVAVKRLDLVES